MSVRGAFVAAGVPVAIAKREAPLAEAAMLEFDITTQARASMFVAQVLHESLRLRYFEEIASGAAYEGRRDLGNTYPGDGRRFKGRGPIQLTGRSNYVWAGKKLGLNLIGHPQLASRHEIGWRIAGLYWREHGLNQLADKGQFETITRRINGGLNGWPDRQLMLRRVRDVDCRPVDKWAGYTPAERRWIAEMDSHPARARRVVLRRVMRKQCQAINAAAAETGMTSIRRKRLRSLEARCEPRKKKAIK